MRPTIYLDMDGVLCDMVGAAMRLHGREDLLQPGAWPKGTYCMEDVLHISATQFWKKIDDEGSSFWADLKLYPWSRALVAKSIRAAETLVCSKPSLNPQSTFGKHQWLTRHFGASVRNYVFTPHKHHLAGPKRILVDDCEENIRQWRNAGGVGILFPQPWNSGTGTVEEVFEMLTWLAS